MRSDTEALLLHEVQPRLRAAIPKMVPMLGADDIDELVQDGVVIAIQLHIRARKAGKKVTAGNLAHYALLHLRAGRRSTGYKQNDALHPAAQINGHSKVQSMDAPFTDGENAEEPLTLHDSIASHADNPATAAARRLDWEPVLRSVDQTKKAILVALVDGIELTRLVRRIKRSRSALQGHKQRLGRLIREQLGEDILVTVQSRPAWTCTAEAVRERLACRAERRAA
jgi:hypothetical protein